MCNIYALNTDQITIRDHARIQVDRTGNMPTFSAVYPDYAAPIIRNGKDGRELVMARWGMPSPAFALQNKKTDHGVTNIRNTSSPHWKRWMGLEHRCVVPFTSFAENAARLDGSRDQVWFTLDPDRPLGFFAGLWVQWTSTRKLKEGEVTADLYGFLTCEANEDVRPIHPKAMPVILVDPDEVETWLNAPIEVALKLQRPLPGKTLMILE